MSKDEYRKLCEDAKLAGVSIAKYARKKLTGVKP